MVELDGLEITNQIELFKNFLSHSMRSMYDAIDDHNWHEDGYFVHEWIQVNWELLVERELTTNKECFSALWMPNPNERVTQKEKSYKYLVLARPKTNKKIIDLCENREINFSEDIRFFGLCAKQDVGFNICPPFDLCHLCHDKKKIMYIVPLDELTIYLKKVP